MTKKSTSINEEKLKELTYQHAKMIGQKLQEEIQRPINISEVDKMDAQIQQGIKLSLEVHRLRNLIEKIDKDKVPDLPFVDNDESYKYAYYLWLLANCTHNQKLIQYTEAIKEGVLKHEKDSD